MIKVICLTAIFLSFLSCTGIDKKITCSSPDGFIKLVAEPVNPAGTFGFSIIFYNDTIVKESLTGITVSDDKHTFTGGLTQRGSESRVIDEVYEMKTGKQLLRKNKCNEVVLMLENQFGNSGNLVFRVYDDGVAYRYELKNDVQVSITRESSGFTFNGISKIWASNYSPTDEMPYGEWRPATEIESRNLSFPVLVNTSAGYWALLTESNVSDYPLSSARFEGERLAYEYPSEEEGRNIVGAGFISPWRAMILGKDLKTVVESCLTDHLSPPTRLKDLSWVIPGVASFPWWGENMANSYPESIKKYIDLSAAMNWRYVEFDIALIGSPDYAIDKWKTADWIKDVTDYGKEIGVYCYGWDDLKNLNTPEKRKEIFSRYNELGLAGIKVDFVSSYTQKVRKSIEDLIRDAAEYKLMVSFHGAQSPRGFARQYPHVITFEAVYGAEFYIPLNGAKSVPPRHNCTLPFTRNVLGSMDYTPVAFSSDIRQTTMAHELALSVIFESGWQVLCDVPDAYLKSVARPFLSKLQNTWDETKFLDGYPGEYCCLARRKGNTWFIAGINCGNARTVSLHLPVTGPVTVQVYTDLDDGLNSLGVKEYVVTGDNALEITMQKNGGFAFII